MKLEFIKLAGGVLSPADDAVSIKMEKFKTNEVYPVEIKQARNPDFHSKMFVFFHFCFDHWTAINKYQFMDEKRQFDIFRKNLVVLAGFYDEYYTITSGKKQSKKKKAQQLISNFIEKFGLSNSDILTELMDIINVFIEDTEVRIEAKSLSFGSMDEEEFEDCYKACVNAAMKNIFKGCDSSVEQKLLSFF